MEIVTETKPEIKETVAEEQNKVQDTLHHVTLAAVGTIALAQDEIERFLNKAVERGAIVEKEARKRISEVTEKRTGARAQRMDKRLQKRLARLNLIKEFNNQGSTILLVEQNAMIASLVAPRGYVLEMGNIIPTKSDIEALNEKIEVLNAKIADLDNKVESLKS